MNIAEKSIALLSHDNDNWQLVLKYERCVPLMELSYSQIDSLFV